jgi:serine/threonine-protein kinase
VVQIYEWGEHQGRLYFSMEYVAGGTLAKLLGHGALGVSAAAELVMALAQAVQAAHAAGVVHRDLKPSNVLLAPDGSPKVADFGLAKLLDDTVARTHTHAVVGTAQYMAPEQAAGKAREVGPAADVYALGCILYECLTGRPHFCADSRSKVLELVQQAQPERPSRRREGLSRDLEAVCLRCLEKRPRDRYGSAGELAADLRRWLKGEPTRARPAGWVRRSWRFVRRHMWAVTLLLLTAGLGLGGTIYFDTERPARTAKAALARGEAVVLVGERGGPRWSRWDNGGDASQSEIAPDGTFSLHSPASGLLRLMRDPGVDRYRLRAEVRHLTAWNACHVGVFFALRRFETSGGPVLLYGQLSFDEVSDPQDDYRRLLALNKWPVNVPPLPPTTAARLFPHLLPVNRDLSDPWGAHGAFQFSEPFQPEGLQPYAAPWRHLSVEVMPQGVQGYWGDRPMRPLSADQFVTDIRKAMADLAIAPETPAICGEIFREISPEFTPRGSLGLVAMRGSASFRNVMIEPLVGPE